jgi:hypothetical protein
VATGRGEDKNNDQSRDCPHLQSPSSAQPLGLEEPMRKQSNKLKISSFSLLLSYESALDSTWNRIDIGCWLK